MTAKDKILYFLDLHRTGLTVTVFAAFVLLFPVFDENPYTLGLTNLIAIYALVVLGLNLFIGYAGQISLGHAAFFGLGAYGSAIATTTHGLPPWPAMVLVAALTALVALVVGLPALRLHGHYLAMATLGGNIVVYTVLVQWHRVTGGHSGFSGIPPLTLGDFAFDDEVRFHYLVWSFTLLALLASLNLVRSGVGRGLSALAADETAAACLGVDVRRAKVKVFVLSAVLASLAGSLFAHCYGFVSPDSFGIFRSVDFVIMVVLGGLGSIWGSLFGAALVTLLPEWIEVFDTYKDLIHGLILVLILMFLPQGLITGLADLAKQRLALYRCRPGDQDADA
ncbi:branched-chain amino acid ABC transporter permease [Geoalkalibacter sp.]|uniref:branched-chain amino acid ABC transporter permease n=1 Tax=Geoalkalibacter sp. TaxID=3041440 RepID=UPI00272E7C56|nr:branched-chain amino acid ABC transporter permease [Geoalkalibacter sp.]